MSDTQYILRLNDKISKAKGTQSADKTSFPFRRGIVSAIEANNTLQVGIIGSDGSTVETIPGCPPWGSGAQGAAIGDLVILYFDPAFPVPFVFAGGGAGGVDAVDLGVAGSIKFFSA